MKPTTLLVLCGLYATAAWFITAGMAKPDSRHVWPGFGGLYAWPESITVHENAEGVLYIYSQNLEAM